MMQTGPQPIKIAILAMGGEGGGVLADWIVEIGEHNGFIAQTTSVPGVAQRTGATVYYVELFALADRDRAGRDPVLALMPTPGDVDIVLASELMEAGRAVQRGLVTPDRTTLITSTHRVYSIAEKSALADGRVDSTALEDACAGAAQRLIRFDMARTAQENGSVISAVLFGALFASGALPFSRAQFVATIERGGVGVKPSLRAFDAGAEGAAAEAVATSQAAGADDPLGTPALPAAPTAEIAALLQRIATGFPAAARPLLRDGVVRLLDYQDPAYAALYLDRIARLTRHGVDELTMTVARHLALWMSYEDTIRVADLKTRASRFARVRDEVRADAAQLLEIDEFMHPRLEEICDTMPAAWGRWLLASQLPRKVVERIAVRGRVVRTTSLRGFLMLFGVASLRVMRRRTLKYAEEQVRIERWLAVIDATVLTDAPLAVEVARCQQLVKGYGDTYQRGLANFETLMHLLQRLGTAGAVINGAAVNGAAVNAGAAPAAGAAAVRLAALRTAALADENGEQFRKAQVAAGLA